METATAERRRIRRVGTTMANDGKAEDWKIGNYQRQTAAYGLLKNPADFLLIVYNGKRTATNDKRQTTNYQP